MNQEKILNTLITKSVMVLDDFKTLFIRQANLKTGLNLKYIEHSCKSGSRFPYPSFTEPKSGVVFDFYDVVDCSFYNMNMYKLHLDFIEIQKELNKHSKSQLSDKGLSEFLSCQQAICKVIFLNLEVIKDMIWSKSKNKISFSREVKGIHNALMTDMRDLIRSYEFC